MKRRDFFALAGGGAIATVLGLKLLPPRELTSADIVKAAALMRDSSYTFIPRGQMNDVIERAMEDIARETARKLDKHIRSCIM